MEDYWVQSLEELLQSSGKNLTFEDIDLAIEKIRTIELENEEKKARRSAEVVSDKQKQDYYSVIEKKINLPIDFDYLDGVETEVVEVQCESVADGLLKSLDVLGLVDISFIASITKQTTADVIEELRGSIYQNPVLWEGDINRGWETADEYLSGNLVRKYQIALDANKKYNGHFQDNIDALQQLIDTDLNTDDIYVTLGSPWVPTDIIDDFIAYMAFGNNLGSKEAIAYYQAFNNEYDAVRHDEYTGLWEIPKKTRFRKGHFDGLFEEVNYRTYGTTRMDMLYILENTLNMKTLIVYDNKDDDEQTHIINQDETIKLLEKQQFMISTFQRWVWEDEKRKGRLQAAYCRKFGNIKQRVYDGSFLELPGLSKNIKLYDYQKNAVARILMSPNTLLAHDVGSGKTYEMIAAGMELRRLGKSKKNLYVVPNNIIGQWEIIFHSMYPGASILVVDSRNFSPKKRADTLNRIVNEDFDGIIMAYSCFDMISPSREFYIRQTRDRLVMLEKAKSLLKSKSKTDHKIKKAKKILTKLELTCKNEPSKTIPFDDLGINTLFVDEAHNYKNIDIESGISRVRGVGGKGSDKANRMLDKVHCVQRMNNGGRVVFATGTPVTNSLTEIYVMQKYLQDGELEYLGLNNFDSWAGMFAEKKTDFEIDIDTNSYHLVTRFAKFKNVPELTSIFSSISDFHRIDDSAGIPQFDEYSDNLLEGSPYFKQYLQQVSKRADDIRNGKVKREEDNMLKLTTDGRKAAIDMRLINENYGPYFDSKVRRCAENIFKEYNDALDTKGNQLVFCDVSTPKDSFNLYHELKRLLIEMGMNEKKVAFIHDADTEKQRQALFQQMITGEIAVLIGSTSKMGHGMNVQEHLVALHHLDVPWRPSDMVQREGRILRQGNKNKAVSIYRYITKNSFDAYSWQLLEIKQRFISQIMSGGATMREGMDVDDSILNYAEVKALAVGNPLIKRRIEVSNEIDRLLILQRTWNDEIRTKEKLRRELPEKIERQEELIRNCMLDIAEYDKGKIDYSEMKYDEQKAIRKNIYESVWKYQDCPVDKHIMDYQGFKVVVPAYMHPRLSKEKEGSSVGRRVPYIHLIKNNTYSLEIEAESGITVRLNNFLENLSREREKHEGLKRTYENRLAAIETELNKESCDYSDEIEKLRYELSMLNKELGVA